MRANPQDLCQAVKTAATAVMRNARQGLSSRSFPFRLRMAGEAQLERDMRAVVLGVCVAVVSVLAGGCSNLPTAVPAQQAALFDDARFGAPTQRISADDVLAMSDEMRQYLKTEIVPLRLAVKVWRQLRRQC